MTHLVDEDYSEPLALVLRDPHLAPLSERGQSPSEVAEKCVELSVPLVQLRRDGIICQLFHRR